MKKYLIPHYIYFEEFLFCQIVPDEVHLEPAARKNFAGDVKIRMEGNAFFLPFAWCIRSSK
jgi:hypothetical protein